MNTIDRQIMGDLTKRFLENRLAKARAGIYPLANLFFFITMRCNAKCSHCFCWEDLNIGIPEPTLEQIDTMARTIPKIRILILTGGEPMLRRDMPEICDAFGKYGNVGEIKVNTNGLAPDKIEALATGFKAKYPETALNFQLSLDGLEATHDRIRGIPGNFEKVIRSLQIIYEMGRTMPLLTTDVLTVINAENWHELDELNQTLHERVGHGLNHGFELVRDVRTTAWNIPEAIRESGVGPKNMAAPPVESFPKIADALRKINNRAPFKANPYIIHNLAQLKMLENGKPQFKCRVAGQAVGVIYSNGDVAACEFTKPFVNLAKYNHDFSALWHGPEATARRTQITGCHCIHGSFHGKAIEYSALGLAKTAGLAL